MPQVAAGWDSIGNNLFRNQSNGQVVDGNHPIYQAALSAASGAAQAAPPIAGVAPAAAPSAATAPGGIAAGWSAIGNNLFRHDATGQVVDGNHPMYQAALQGQTWAPPAPQPSAPMPAAPAQGTLGSLGAPTPPPDPAAGNASVQTAMNSLQGANQSQTQAAQNQLAAANGVATAATGTMGALANTSAPRRNGWNGASWRNWNPNTPMQQPMGGAGFGQIPLTAGSSAMGAMAPFAQGPSSQNTDPMLSKPMSSAAGAAY